MAEESPKKDERRYSVEDLKERARSSLGVSPIVVAGALFGEKKKEFTLAEAERKVNAFLSREVVAESEQADLEGAEE